MRKFVTLLLSVFLLVSGSLFAGCERNSNVDNSKNNPTSKSEDKKVDMKKLIDSLNPANELDSLEGEITTITEVDGKRLETKMTMQTEGMRKDTKAKATMEMLGVELECYLISSNGKTTVYIKDPTTGKYIVTEQDMMELTNADLTESFATYVDILEKNSDLLTQKSDNTYELKIPKEKVADIYKQLTKQDSVEGLVELVIEYVIGDNDYIKELNVGAKGDKMSFEMKCSYKNHNKKFNIEIPEVTE